MALTKITSSVIGANAIAAAGIAENSVTTSEIATNGVQTLNITDSAVTSAKLDTNIDIAGTLDVTGVLTADSNVVIAGNLTVNGSTVTNSATNTTIEDLLIELGTGTTGSPSSDAGIVIERGDSDNAFIGWDESADSFIVGTGSFTGASTGNLTISTAPLTTGTLIASGLTYPTSDGSSGQFLKTNGSGTLSFDSVTSVVDNYTATGDGSTTAFDTGINPGNEVNTWVFIDGVYQQKSEYSYSGSTITFSTAPDNGATIDVTTGTVGGFASSDTVLGVYEATTTATDTYSTGISASNENNTWVFVGGVYQPKDSYTFSSGTLTFDANTPAGEKLSVVATKTLTASAVTTSAIAANAVTSAKIASNSILSRHIANNSIVGADISATTQITASTFTGALTGNVTGNVTGNLNGLSYPSSDGTNGQVLTTNGSGTLSFSTISGYTDSDVETYLNTSTIYTDATNNRLGIGESSPDAHLHIKGTGGASPAYIYLEREDTAVNADNEIGGLHFYAGESSATKVGAIRTIAAEAFTSTSSPTYMIFETTASGSTDDSERMRIDSSGNVGIGMTPVALGSDTVLSIYNSATPRIKLHNSTTGTTSTDGAEINMSSSDLIIENREAGNQRFFTNGSERMRIDASGNVGIGTSSIARGPLHLATSGTNYCQVHMTNGTSGSTSSDGLTLFTNGTDAGLMQRENSYLLFGTNDTERMRIASSGSVGIGTTSPSSAYKLDIAGKQRIVNNADTFALTLERTAATTGAFGLGLDGDGFYRLSSASQVHQQIDDNGISYYRAYTDMTFGTGSSGTERMRITSDGRVGIGTSSPTAGVALDVQNYLRAGNLYLGNLGGTHRLEGGNGHIYPGDMRLTAGATNMNIDFQVVVTGVGISTEARLDSPTGDWYTNDGSVSSLSDERVKTDITDLSDGLEIVKQLRPVTFKYNDNSEDEYGNKLMGAARDKVRYGFIAQEVEQVAPQYVETGIGYVNNEEVDDFKSMSTTRMIPMLFKAIQEQQTIIDDLKSRIETLENN